MMTLLLGGNGLLGRHVAGALIRAGRPFVAPPRSGLDICDLDAGARLLEKTAPGAVINCAALCNLIACEENPVYSRAVNRDAPVAWAQMCAARGIRFLQFSSDYIFDGAEHVPYTEASLPAPLSRYGHDKAAMEAAVVGLSRCLVLRISWLFGAGGKTFLSMLPSLLMENEEVAVAAGKTGSCLHAGYAADVTLRLAETDHSGILNLANSGETSWEAFADTALIMLQSKGFNPACRQIRRAPFREIPALAGGNRPEYSPLDTTRLSTVLGEPIPRWETALDHSIAQLARPA